jgi:hypothetical protein
MLRLAASVSLRQSLAALASPAPRDGCDFASCYRGDACVVSAGARVVSGGEGGGSTRVVSAGPGAGAGGGGGAGGGVSEGGAGAGVDPDGACVVSEGAGEGRERRSISRISTPRFSTTNSTRRLSARPASVAFDAMGLDGPYPFATNCSGRSWVNRRSR